jgi:hypothetical protein
MRKLWIVIPLLLILVGSAWYAYDIWTSLEGPSMPPELYIALILGVVFSFVIGSGLMALMFYSSRRGYDEQADWKEPGRQNRSSAK